MPWGEGVEEFRSLYYIVDLKYAYLQIHVAEKLWRYQQMRYTGKTYCLTGFGYLECTNMTFRYIENLNSKEIKERIRDWDTRKWKKEVQNKAYPSK